LLYISIYLLDFTVCFGIASFFTSVGGLNLNKNLYYRDSFIYLFTLSILTFFLKDNIINIYEAITLVLLFPLYLYISTTQLSNVDTDTLTNEQSPFQNNESKFDFNVSNELKSLRNQQNICNESHMMRLK
jgi:Ca2+/Na+ antiporter